MHANYTKMTVANRADMTYIKAWMVIEAAPDGNCIGNVGNSRTGVVCEGVNDVVVTSDGVGIVADDVMLVT